MPTTFVPYYNLHSDAGNALDIGSWGDAYIANGILLSSNGASALIGGSDDQVDLEGQAAGVAGVLFQGDANHLVVGMTGYAWGSDSAVAAIGSYNVIENYGRITGASTGVHLFGGTNNELINNGVVSTTFGKAIFIQHAVASETSLVINHGLIDGMNGGGGAYTAMGIGDDTVINTGTINGRVYMAEGNDLFDTSAGTMKGEIEVGDGNDTVLGSAGNDSIIGDLGDDRLTGNAGKDSLDGDDGLDSLTGGAGADKLTGGFDADHFIFTSKTDSGTTSSTEDHILDFTHSEADRIDLSKIDAKSNHSGNDAFHFLAKGAFTHHAGDLHYSVNSAGNALVSGDVNGDGRADFTIVLDHVSHLVAGDFIL